jgi:hypothetical protein
MEHEYVVPEEGEVRLFSDVVALFIDATERYVGKHEMEFENENIKDPKFSRLEVMPEERKMVLNWKEGEIPANHPLYVEILGLAVRLERA